MGVCASSEPMDPNANLPSILMCGTSAVGKSTILKNLMHMTGYSTDDQDEAVARYEMKRMTIETLNEMMKECLLSNAAPPACKGKIEALLDYTRGALKFYETFDQGDHEGKSRRESLRVDFSDTNALFAAAKSLWADPAMTECLDHVKEWMELSPPFLQDSMVHIMTPKYFEKFSQDTFKLDKQDILLIRRTTRGSTEYKFKFDKLSSRIFAFDDESAQSAMGMKMIDVGGHASERALWSKHYTATLSCIIYVVALDDYCKKLPKANAKGNELRTKLDDSLNQFKILANDVKTADKPYVVCLNKFDELERKARKNKKAYKLERFYKDFRPRSKKKATPEEMKEYIGAKYKTIIEDAGKTVRKGKDMENGFQMYVCVAIDPKLTEKVLINVISITIAKAMEDNGMM